MKTMNYYNMNVLKIAKIQESKNSRIHTKKIHSNIASIE